MKRCVVLLLVLLAVIFLWRIPLPVDETEYVIVTSFGRVIGDPIHEAGLHAKKPWQSAIRLDKRLQTFDPRASEFLLVSKKKTEEGKGIGQNVIVDYFVNWRVLGIHSTEVVKGMSLQERAECVAGPLTFLKSVANSRKAEDKLKDVVHSELSAALGRHDMSGLVSVDPKDLKIREIEKAVTDACRDIARKSYGIEIEDVRLKRIGLPEQNKQSVFARMRSERQTKATEFRSEGESRAIAIRATADKEATKLRSQAYKEAELLRGKGDAEATKIYAKAHSKDPEFYRLVRTLDAYKKFLNENTTVVLSGDSELLRLLTAGQLSAPKSEPGTAKPKAKPTK